MPRPVRLFGGDSRGSRDGAVLAGGITPSLAARSLSRITYKSSCRRRSRIAAGQRVGHLSPRAASPPSSSGAVAPSGPDILAPSLGATDMPVKILSHLFRRLLLEALEKA